jgi:hypothetical protein
MGERVVRGSIAAVWLAFGLGAKVLGLVPRHRRIVAAVLGERLAGPVTVTVGLGETALGLWVLSGRRPRTAAALQTAAIASMNALELSRARSQLLAPWPMVAANTAFLAVVWAHAIAITPPRPPRIHR